MNIFPRLLSIFALISISVLLSGCLLKSEEPLLDTENGELILEDVNYIAFENKDKKSSITHIGKDIIDIERVGGENFYTLTMKGKEKNTLNISFHKLSLGNLFIAQMFDNKSNESSYLVAERIGQYLYLFILRPSKKEYSKLIELGYSPTPSSGNKITPKNIEIGNGNDLKKLAEILLKHNRLDTLKPHKKTMPLKLFSDKSDLEAELNRASLITCLQRAGHPSTSLPRGVSGVGNMTKIDTKKARPLCENALDRNETNKSVRYALARIAYVDKQYASVVEFINPLIKEDFPMAHLLKGQMFELGAGLPKDGKKALEHYKLAAKYGAKQALQTIGTGYNRGTFGSIDKELAFSYFLQAAQHEVPAAMTSLAFAYYNGSGVKKDFSESAKFAKQAADFKDTNGEYLFGYMLLHGQGVQKDPTKARSYVERAAMKKHVSSQSLMGDIYRNGLGVPKNSRTALKWYKKAAAENHAYSQYVIGWMYSEGRGVKKDTKLSIKWLEKAAANKSASAKKLLASVKEKEKRKLKAQIDAKIAALKAELKGPSAEEIKVALQERLNVGFKRLDAMGDMCKDVQRNQNPIAAVMCLSTLGGQLNSRSMGMNVSQVTLDKCHAMKSKSFICRYKANISGNPGNQNPWMGMMTALRDFAGYQYASFVRSGSGWSVQRIYESCTISAESANCTYKK